MVQPKKVAVCQTCGKPADRYPYPGATSLCCRALVVWERAPVQTELFSKQADEDPA